MLLLGGRGCYGDVNWLEWCRRNKRRSFAAAAAATMPGSAFWGVRVGRCSSQLCWECSGNDAAALLLSNRWWLFGSGYLVMEMCWW